MFVLEPAEAAKHSRKLLPYIHHYYSVTFKILYWPHALQISMGCFTRLTPKMVCKTRASIFKMIIFLGKNGSDNTCTFRIVSVHFFRCYFICDLIVGSICLLISGYILVKVGSTGPSMPSSLIKRREEKVGVSLWVTIYVNMNKENHWFVPQVWEESGLMYLALLLRTPSTAGDRN